MSHYETLGVDKGADTDSIKRAYRKRAQRAHPDKGGSVVEFQALQKAYDILSDAERRARYDRGEKDEPAQTIQQIANSEVARMALGIVDDGDVRFDNLKERMMRITTDALKKCKGDRAKLEESIKRREEVVGRWSKKGEGHNLIAIALQADIRNRRMALSELDRREAVTREMLKIINDYEYRCDIYTPTEREVRVMMGDWR